MFIDASVSPFIHRQSEGRENSLCFYYASARDVSFSFDSFGIKAFSLLTSLDLLPVLVFVILTI